MLKTYSINDINPFPGLVDQPKPLSAILLCQMPDYFTHQGRASRWIGLTGAYLVSAHLSLLTFS